LFGSHHPARVATTMITIDQLRYVRLGTRNLPKAVDFAQRILGLQLIEHSDRTAYFRSDFRDHTLVFFLGEPTEQAVGFEIHGQEQFESAIAALSLRGVNLTPGQEAECSERKVRALASFRDPAGNTIELVLRPLNSGWRYFPSRDAGVTGLSGVAMCATDAAACEKFWTTMFNGRISDWVGGAAFLRFDDAHHRLAYYPSTDNRVLAVEFGVESVDLLMQNSYFVQSAQIRIVHGPGRRPTSNQMFLTFAGPEGTLFSFVAEGDRVTDEAKHRPRQFPRARLSFCAWGSESEAPEFRRAVDREG
jgi:2,3-dihydroxy-p-cumate/2,3-dihydroxybenzoate 3,4-dioxygenase